MDQLPAFGRSIFPALVPTFKAYAPLHEKNRANIESTPRVEFQYGEHPRQKLDFYCPKDVADDTPVLVFVYGGGLSRGDKRMPSPPTAEGLVYANIGHYFASRGFVTVIPDYRRTGEGATFPSGGDDIALALEWVKTRFNSGTHKLYVMGNSAGAVHSATWLLDSKFADSRASVQNGAPLALQGVVLVSIPAHFQAAGEDRADILTAYYKDRIEQDCVHGLTKRAQPPQTKTLVVTGTLDPEDEICEPSQHFVDVWKEKFGDENLKTVVLEGHNHFSTVMSLGTGIEKEESLGAAVLAWLKEI